MEALPLPAHLPKLPPGARLERIARLFQELHYELAIGLNDGDLTEKMLHKAHVLDHRHITPNGPLYWELRMSFSPTPQAFFPRMMDLPEDMMATVPPWPKDPSPKSLE